VRKTVTITAVAMAVAFITAPLAAAEWKAFGGYEPDSRYDDADFNHLLKPSEHQAEGKANPLYFNAYLMGRPGFGGGALNPNNAITKSQATFYTSNMWHALLGLWTDCNGDGYVGIAETAAREYRSELLTAAQLAACPSAHKIETKAAGRTVGILIVEFITVAKEGNGIQDSRSIVDPDAMIWGDVGKPFPNPGDVEFYTPELRCAGGTTAGPKGSWEKTGSALNNLECSTGRRGIAVWNTVVPTVLGEQYRFTGEHYDQPGHPVAEREFFGNDDRKNTYVAWANCDAGPVVDLKPLGSDRAGHGPRPPRSNPQVNTNGNFAGTFNDTYESAIQNCKTQAQGDPSKDYDREFYEFIECASVKCGLKRGKVYADYNLIYREMSRSAIPCGPATQSQDCGIPALNGILGSSTFGANSFWSATDGAGGPSSTYNTRDLAEGKLTRASYYTFYANVGANTLARGDTPGGASEYGAAFCGSGGYEQTGATQFHFGWDCNKHNWNKGGDGTITFAFAAPGQPYQFRDVDCFDGTLVKGTPLTVSAQKFSDEPCWSSDLPSLG